MNIKALYVSISIILLNLFNVQSEPATLDTVYYYNQGECEPEFKDNPNFPDNIFGIPSRNATSNIPASSIAEIEAIGLGGEIIVGFKNRVLINGPGTDFVVFENAFINPVGNGIFAEPGIVSVSQNGIDYFDFPFNPTTLEGLAGISPIYGDEDPFNPEKSGGDKFDLDALGLGYIKYIKIRDTTLLVKSLPPGHKYKNPDFLLTGFDLDAIVGLYLESESLVSVLNQTHAASISLTNQVIEVRSYDDCEIDIRIYSLLGELILSKKAYKHNIDITNYSSGLYVVEAIMNRNRSYLKFVK